MADTTHELKMHGASKILRTALNLAELFREGIQLALIDGPIYFPIGTFRLQRPREPVLFRRPRKQLTIHPKISTHTHRTLVVIHM